MLGKPTLRNCEDHTRNGSLGCRRNSIPHVCVAECKVLMLTFPHSSSTASPLGKWSLFSPHSTREETELMKGQVTCPKSCS